MSIHQPAKPPATAYAILTMGILAVSTAAIFIRFAQEGAPSLIIAASRLTIATLILAPFALTRSWAEMRGLSRIQIRQILLSGLFLAVHFAAWISSLEWTSVVSSVVLVTTTPLWVAILSPLVLRERLRKEVWIGLALALSGGLLVGLQQACSFGESGISCLPLEEFIGGRALFGNFLALLGAWMAAGYMLVGRKVRPHLTLIPYTFLVYGSCAILLIIAALASGNTFSGYSPSVWGLFVLLALVPQLLGHSSLNWALRYLPATFVALALLGEPVGTTLLAMLFLKETPAIGEIFGGVLILLGIYLASLRGDQSQPQDSSK